MPDNLHVCVGFHHSLYNNNNNNFDLMYKLHNIKHDHALTIIIMHNVMQMSLSLSELNNIIVECIYMYTVHYCVIYVYIIISYVIFTCMGKLF